MHDSSTGKRFQHRRQQSRRNKTNGFALPNIFTVQLQKQKRQQQQKTHNVSWPSMASTKTNEHTLNKEAEPLRSDNYVCTARGGEAFFPNVINYHPRWKAEHYICTWTERAGTPCGPNQPIAPLHGPTAAQWNAAHIGWPMRSPYFGCSRLWRLIKDSNPKIASRLSPYLQIPDGGARWEKLLAAWFSK